MIFTLIRLNWATIHGNPLFEWHLTNLQHFCCCCDWTMSRLKGERKKPKYRWFYCVNTTESIGFIVKMKWKQLSKFRKCRIFQVKTQKLEQNRKQNIVSSLEMDIIRFTRFKLNCLLIHFSLKKKMRRSNFHRQKHQQKKKWTIINDIKDH